MSAIVAWWLYGGVVSALLGVGALVLEAGAREVDRPARWIWLGALGLGVVLPLVAYLSPGEAGGGMGGMPDIPVLALPVIAIDASSRGYGWGVDRVLLAAWAMTSLVLAVLVLRSAWRLRSERAGWRRSEVMGVPVWMTEDLGPAVFGLRGPVIVLPRWVLGLEKAAQQLLLIHEREHVRAGDPRALLSGLAVVVLFPWNPVLWWMLARLRLAVEMDCDARVLRRAPDARAYGRVLLEVGRRRSSAAMLVAFAEPRRFLERRIRRITAKRSLHAGRGAGLALLAVLPVVVAVCARDPMAVSDPMEAASLEAPALTVQVPDGPRFTPATVRPELVNAAAVAEALKSAYPPLLRDAGISGRATVWFYIDETGRVMKVQLNESSGYDALDRAALSVAGMMQFTPALNRDKRVKVWVSIPIAFSSGGSRAAGSGTNTAREVERTKASVTVASPRADARTPTFTPITQAAVIENPEEVQRALQRSYPPLLRDAGIGGQAQIWLFVETDGRVSRTQVAETSGYEALDKGALAVVSVMRFAPAQNRGQPVAAWMKLPVSFSSK